MDKVQKGYRHYFLFRIAGHLDRLQIQEFDSLVLCDKDGIGGIIDQKTIFFLIFFQCVDSFSPFVQREGFDRPDESVPEIEPSSGT